MPMNQLASESDLEWPVHHRLFYRLYRDLFMQGQESRSPAGGLESRVVLWSAFKRSVGTYHRKGFCRFLGFPGQALLRWFCGHGCDLSTPSPYLKERNVGGWVQFPASQVVTPPGVNSECRAKSNSWVCSVPHPPPNKQINKCILLEKALPSCQGDRQRDN